MELQSCKLHRKSARDVPNCLPKSFDFFFATRKFFDFECSQKASFTTENRCVRLFYFFSSKSHTVDPLTCSEPRKCTQTCPQASMYVPQKARMKNSRIRRVMTVQNLLSTPQPPPHHSALGGSKERFSHTRFTANICLNLAYEVSFDSCALCRTHLQQF